MFPTSHQSMLKIFFSLKGFIVLDSYLEAQALAADSAELETEARGPA